MGNWIAFIHVKRFYVRVYRQMRLSLGRRPLVVARNGKVLEACSLAQAEGVSTGIPLRQVRCLCPQAQIVTCNPDDCIPLYRQIWDIVAAYSPVVEPIDFHRGFVDITKVLSSTNQAQAWQKEISRQIQQQTDLQVCIGIGPGKFIARVAVDHNAVVVEEDAREFLAPISLSGLDWLDYKLRDTLQRLGLPTLDQVAGLDKNTLIQQTEQLGGQLHNWINGKDDRAVQPLYPPREERVVHTFDIEDRQGVIIQALDEICEQLGNKLQSTASQTRRLTLQVEDVAGHHMHTQQYSRSLKDALRLYQATERLLKQLWEGQPLLSIEIVAEDLQPVDHHQLSLWGSYRHGKTEQALQIVCPRYGGQAVSKASELEDKRRFAQMILAAEGKFTS